MYFCVNEFEVGVNDSIFCGNKQQKVYYSFNICDRHLRAEVSYHLANSVPNNVLSPRHTLEFFLNSFNILFNTFRYFKVLYQACVQPPGYNDVE